VIRERPWRFRPGNVSEEAPGALEGERRIFEMNAFYPGHFQGIMDDEAANSKTVEPVV
jgi:hypothetical protein